MKRRFPCARGSLYVVALATATIVTLVGVSALLSLRVWQRSLLTGADVFAARSYALSAIELGRFAMVADPKWRRNLANGNWITEKEFDRGRLSLRGVDRGDGDLADSEADAVELTGTGRCGPALFHLRVNLVPPARALGALRTCLHASGDINISGGKVVTVVGAPLSSNRTINCLGTIRGDVEADQLIAMTPVGGGSVVPAPPKKAPDPTVFDRYAALAVTIPYSSQLEKGVLAPGMNPWGAASVDGVYRINTSGKDLNIKGMRIQGTLLVNAGNRLVTIGPDVLIEPARADYPALIIKGDVKFDFDSHGELREQAWNVNYNPPAAPYCGRSDEDTNDKYATEVRGLVHIAGDLLVSQHAVTRGVVICEGAVTIQETLQMIHDPELYSAPPMHYLEYGVPAPPPDGFRQVLDPNA